MRNKRRSLSRLGYILKLVQDSIDNKTPNSMTEAVFRQQGAHINDVDVSRYSVQRMP